MRAGLSIDFMRTRHNDILNTIGTSGALPEEDVVAAIIDFKTGFRFESAEGVGGPSSTTAADAVGPATSPETLETE